MKITVWCWLWLKYDRHCNWQLPWVLGCLWSSIFILYKWISEEKRHKLGKSFYYMTASIPKCIISRHEAQGKAEREREREKQHRSCLSLPLVGTMAVFMVPDQFGAVLLMRSQRHNVFLVLANNCLKFCFKLLSNINEIFAHQLLRSLHDNSTDSMSLNDT